MQIKYFYFFCVRLSRAHFSIIMTGVRGQAKAGIGLGSGTISIFKDN
jgi:hypothetical protein